MRLWKTLVFAVFAAVLLTSMTTVWARYAAGGEKGPIPRADGHGRDGRLDNQGGPDALQYVYHDNVAPDNVPYNWIELRGDNAATWLGGLTHFTGITDGYSRQKLPLGFSFPFYGTTYDSVRVATNGFLQFTTTATWLNNACLPSALVAGPMIAVFWDDLHLLRGGRTDTVVVGYRSFGTYMVIEFDQIGFFSCPNVPLKFEAILYPNGDIKLQYNSIPVPTDCANSQTIGIQQAGSADSAALNYVCSTTGIQPADGRAVLFSRPNGIANPVTNLAAEYVAPNVVLNWTDPTHDTNGNPIIIDNVQVWQGEAGSGQLLATVPRGVQTYTEVSPPHGDRLYSVRPYCSPYPGPTAICSVMVGVPSYFNDFETDGGGWVADQPTGGWEWGVPTFATGPTAHSGTKLWGTVLNGNYPNNACVFLTLTPGMPVTSETASVEFWCWYDAEQANDGVNFKVSVDNGNSWTVVQPVGNYPYATPTTNVCIPREPCWSGNTGGTWTRIVLPIGQFVGQTPQFRFTLGTNGTTRRPGFYFDDMFIWGLTASSITGVVRSFGNNLPVPDARVQVEGLTTAVTTDAGGTYLVYVDPGTYSVSIDNHFFCDSTYTNVVVDAGAQTTLDAVLRHPVAQISRSSVTLRSNPGAGVADTFRISNSGGPCPLSFAIADTSAWLTITPDSGTVNPHQSVTITLNVDAPETIGDYSSSFTIAYNAVGTPSRVRVDLEIVDAADDLKLIPTEFAYHQNYPNPFNAQTTLRFDVPQQSRVRISLYNVMGQEVARLVDQEYAPGRYGVHYDASGLPSGIYLVRMSAANYSKIGKMMLLK
jgi:hypothetical protein